MGVDLKVLPVRKGKDMAHSVVSFNRDKKLFTEIDEIEELNGIPIEKPIWSYFGDEYSCTINTAYGKVMKRLEPSDFLDLASNYSYNNSILLFLRSLPSDYEILLYWH